MADVMRTANLNTRSEDLRASNVNTPAPKPASAPRSPRRLRNGQPVIRLNANAAQSASGHLPETTTGGEPLSPAVQNRIERSLNVNLQAVRVHQDGRAENAAKGLSARAFTIGNQIFLGRGGQPGDVGLIAHEAAHVVQQQGAPGVQRFASGQSDACEREAQQAASAVLSGNSFTVRERAGGQRVQRLGLSDALDYFADKANLIPGFRMFTIILGVNPINMSRVERSAANILRALIEFIPGGGLISQALDNYGVFERVGNWVEQQIRALGMTGSVIRDAINRFLDSLSWSDIFDLGGVWERAKRIFTEPINRIISFVGGLVSGIIGFIKDAILRPLARLAEGTRGYDLLKAVLGQDPITGEPVPRNAETLIGGFMKLIGQEEVWNNLRRANAVARAWAWFQGALSGLLGFVRQIPSLFMQALQSLELADIVLLPRAFVKVARVFGGFLGQFFSWAGQQVLSLLQIIFEVVAPAAVPYIRRAAGAFRKIIENPIAFIRNLVRAGIQGFRQFATNFLTHLRTALINWLTGTLSGATIYIPQAFNLREIIKFVLSVLGLTWQNIRQKLVRVVGETTVRALETGFEIVVTLVTQGPAAAWEKIKESISNLQQMVIEGVMTFVRDRIVQAAITRLVTSLNPAGAFIQAIIAIYNTIMFFVERLRQIAQVAMSFIDSIAAIANGVIGAAADRVERTMAGLLTLVISFLARLVGLGRVSDAVVNIINRVRAPIDRALDRVVDWIVTQARRLGRFVAQAGLPNDPNQRLELGLNAATAAVNALRDTAVTAALINPALSAIKVRYGFRTLQPVERNGEWWVEGQINPGGGKKTRKRTSVQGRAVAATLIGQNIDSLSAFPQEYQSVTFDGKKDIQRTGRGYAAPELSCQQNGTIKQGRDIRRADYFLIDEYNAEIARIVADLGHALQGNPASLPPDLHQRVQAGVFHMANGIRASMKRIIAFLKGPNRLNFTGVEVSIGEGRSADYTITVNDSGVTKNVLVEVKNWTTITNAKDLVDKGARLSTQLSAYVRLAKTAGNNYDLIHLEWVGWSRLDAAAKAKFSGIINAYKGQATRKGITLTFNPM